MKKVIFIALVALIFATWGATIYYAMKAEGKTADAGTSTTAESIVESTYATIETIDKETTAETTKETSAVQIESTPGPATTVTEKTTEQATLEQLREFRVNETGVIYILMFHGFISDDMGASFGDREYTMTFSQFGNTLQMLYDMDYRPISMDEFLNGHIDVPLGKIPVVLTFDDGRSGQFNLIEQNGELVANPDSAVGIWLEFNESHPDFSLKGTFYVNLGLGTFEGKGTLQQRLRYIIDLGFEIGNHTYTHEALRLMTRKDDVIYQMGKNQEVMDTLVPGYKMTSLALPYGEDVKPDELKEYVVKGAYNGTQYHHLGVLDCKWKPSYSPFSVNYDSRMIYRVRADGLDPVACDMSDWMFTKLTTTRGQFISDGDPDIVTVPVSLESDVNRDAAGGREIITYILE